MEYKAKKICTMGNAFYWESIFEYRGHEYTVKYSSGYTTIKQIPAIIQHKQAQARIDDLIENPPQQGIKKGTFDINKIYEIAFPE